MQIFNKIPRSMQDVAKLISGDIGAKVIGFAVLIFYTRVLSKEEMAIFPIFLMLSHLASLVFSLGIYPILLIELPSLFRKDFQHARSLFYTGGFLLVLGTSLVMMLFILFSR